MLLLVPRDIAVEFRLPECHVGLRHRRRLAALVAVPEAAVHEDDRVPLGQHDVGVARQFGRMEAEAEAQGMQMASHDHLGLRVLRPNVAHHLAALLWSDCIHRALWQICLFYRHVLLKTAVGTLGNRHCQAADFQERINNLLHSPAVFYFQHFFDFNHAFRRGAKGKNLLYALFDLCIDLGYLAFDLGGNALDRGIDLCSRLNSVEWQNNGDGVFPETVDALVVCADDFGDASAGALADVQLQEDVGEFTIDGDGDAFEESLHVSFPSITI